MQSMRSRPLPKLLKRSVLLGGVATLSLACANTARAQSIDNIVDAREGETIQGDIVLTDGDDRLIVDHLRLASNGSLNLGANNGNPPIATGSLVTDGSGADQLWVIADANSDGVSAIRNAPTIGFDGADDRVVYEALGENTSLILASAVDELGADAVRRSTVYLAGNGTIGLGQNVQINTAATTGRAIYVERDRTSVLRGLGDGRLNLSLAGSVFGGLVTEGDQRQLIDVIHADRFELTGTAAVSLIAGTGIYATDQEVVIGETAEVLARDSDIGLNPNQNAFLITMRGPGTIQNRGSLREQGDADVTETDATVSVGVLLRRNGTLVNESMGTIAMHGYGVEGAGDGTILNRGLIQSDMRSAISTAGQSDYLVTVRNEATGIIQGINRLAGGGIAFTTAYNGGGETDIVVNAGTINGDVRLGGGADAFLASVDPATGNLLGTVNGLIDGGVGNQDAWGRSYSADGSFALADADVADLANVRIGFERHGVEALGSDTDVLLTSSAPLARGLTLFGEGTITNDADITLPSGPSSQNGGINHAIKAEGNHRLGFINRGRVEALNGFAFQSVYGELASFDNAAGAELVARNVSGGGVVVEINARASTQPFRFNNSGAISHSGSGLGVALRGENGYPNGTIDPTVVTFTNSGTISGATGAIVNGPTGAGPAGMIDIDNSGGIVGRNQGLGVGGNSIELDNSGLIEAQAGAAIAMVATIGADGKFSLANGAGGRIAATAAGVYSDPASGGNGNVRASSAVLLNLAQGLNGNATSANIVNEAGAVIEAPQGSSIAIVALGEQGSGSQIGSAFELTNRGTVTGTGVAASTGILLGNTLAFDGATTAAGAIQTYQTADRIVNDGSGAINGDVDLNMYGDRFEARGTSTLTGNLRLGEGDDTVLLAGGTITGNVAGGADDDTIAVDLSVAEQTISADQYSGFENIVRETAGSGIVNVVGAFDTASLDIRGVTLRVRQGTAVRTTGDRTFDGSSEAERLIVDGMINDSVRLGAGDDRVELGNAGAIGGDLELGTGNDTVVLGSNSWVGATLDGGEDANGQDNDIIGFELTQDMASAPAVVGDAVNFETIQVSGNHKLALALEQSYQAISLINGADLDLAIDAGVTLGGIRGDATDQNVTITGELTGGVSLGGGNDTLTMNGFEGTLSTVLDGGDGTDILNLNIVGTTTFGSGAAGFETINVDGTARLVIDGDFAAGQTLNFGGGDNHLEIASGAAFGGTVNGGAGNDTMTIGTNAPDSRTVVSAQINGFEWLDVGGDGTLALTGGDYNFAGGVNVVEGGNLELGANTHLAANVTFSDAHDDRLTLSSGARITGAVDAGERAGDRDVLAFQQAAGQVSRLGDFGLSSLVGFEQMAVLGAGEFHIDQNLAAFDSVVLEGGNLVVDAGSTLDADVLGRDVADPAAVATDDMLSVLGIVAGNVSLGGGDDTVDNRGRIVGDVDLGAGNDRYIARDGGVVTGTIDGGAGDNTFIFRLGGQNGSIPGNVVNFNSIGAYGAGTLEIALNAGQDYANLELLEGANLVLTDNGGTVGNIIGDGTAQQVTIGTALVGGVNLGGGDDILDLTLNGTLSGTLLGGENADGSADNDRLNLALAGNSQIGGMNEFETVRVSAADGVRLTVTGAIGDGQSITFEGDTDNELALTAGATLQGVVDGGAGTDLLDIETGGTEQRTVVTAQIRNFENLVANGSGTLVLLGGNYGFNSVAGNGNLTLGAGVVLTAANGVTFGEGDNRLTIASGADIQGAVNAGGGNDTLALSQAAGFTRSLSDLDVAGFERLETSGAGTLRIDRPATYSGGVAIDGGTTIVTDSAQLTGSITGGANADTLEVFGRVTGNVDLGAGNDRLVVGSLTGIGGSVRGGDGTDAVVFDTDATYAAPVVVAGNLFDGFESLGVRRGVVSLTGASTWTDIDVTGGRLIGQAGSTLTADRVNVAAGATFGSAGIVNADIDVLGTLSPGASPGTMTVNGDVTMRAGSNLLIELTPTAGRDLLDVNGTLAIANGAAMDITGALGNVPGSVLDIVVADTITGRFTTINKSASVFGFVVQNGNRIQIRSEFNNSDAFPSNIQSSVGYSNQVLRDSYGVQAYTAALGVLTAADGTINQRAFAQLTPEAYGSAMQLGIENGLQLVDAGRALRLTAPRANGLYGFAQGLTGDSDIAGQADTGASRADLRSHGLLGGIGYGMGDGQLRLGAFVGRSDIDQRLTALDATTDAKGFFGGVFADAAIGGVGLHAMVSYSDLDAETRRRLAVSSTAATSDYGLKSWVADMSIDYSVKLGGIDVTPKAGLSHVRTSRGAVTEQGAGDFALAVRGDHASAWFGDAGVAVSGTTRLGGMGLTPYVEVGVRRQLGKGEILVSGSYDGAPGAPIVVHGVERDRTVGRFGLGLGIDAGQNLRFRLGYTGEFDNTRRASITASASFRF